MSFDYGSILVSGVVGDAIEMYDAQFCLRVSVISRQMNLIFDNRPLAYRRRTLSCLVRTNVNYITSVNMSVFEVQFQCNIPLIPVPVDDSLYR